jgi:IS4 transposase
MKKSKFTEAQIVFAIKQFETGTRVDEISRQMGISQATTAYETASEPRFVYDDNIKLVGQKYSSNYPHTLRSIENIDTVTAQELAFLTNHKDRTAPTVAELYKQRWNIEVFDKNIKSHLRIKSFVDKSGNADNTQIWTS